MYYFHVYDHAKYRLFNCINLTLLVVYESNDTLFQWSCLVSKQTLPHQSDKFMTFNVLLFLTKCFFTHYLFFYMGIKRAPLAFIKSGITKNIFLSIWLIICHYLVKVNCNVYYVLYYLYQVNLLTKMLSTLLLSREEVYRDSDEEWVWWVQRIVVEVVLLT